MSSAVPLFLTGDGECRAAARAFDWTTTALGAPETWPSSLKTTAGIVFGSRHPMLLFWGKDLVQLYNDAFLPSCIGKHPTAMGQSGRACWAEAWPIIGGQIEDVMAEGRASYHVDQLVPIFRSGRIEDVYWTYGYSPVLDDDGSIGGTLVVCSETTERVVAERRLGVLRALSAALHEAREFQDVTRALVDSLGRMTADIPFALVDAGGLPLAAGLDPKTARALDEALRGRLDGAVLQPVPIPLTAGPWPEPPTQLFVAPTESGRALVFGLSARLRFDGAYRAFLLELVELVAAARARIRVEVEHRGLLEQAPVATALMIGPEHVFELANARYCAMVGRDVLGKRYVDAFPELRDGPLPAILDRVYRDGEPFVTGEMVVPLRIGPNGAVGDRWFKFNLQPIRNAEGVVFGMMAIAIDVTEQVVARRALEKTNLEREALLVKAEAAGRAKDEFLAMLGHELRNPLAPIITALDVLKLKDGDQVTREHAIIERQATHLIHLVDDLLDVSRVARGKIELKKSRVFLADVVARAVEIATPLFERRGQSLTVDVSADLSAFADPVRLRQIVANVLSNAAKYTPERGNIAVRGFLAGEELVLEVEDDGIGISPTQAPHLFEAFFQGPRSSERAEGGLGLGLALVKSLMTLHGGTVSVRSPGPGLGSVFELRLPTATSVRRALEAQEREEPSRHVTPLRVLLVDDNNDLADMFAILLEKSGLDVRTAYDGPSALEIAEEFRPDVAVVDIGLPVMDGYELASRLRERLGSAAPRMIAMTGYGQDEDRAQAARAGFELHLVKPVDGPHLLKAIEGKRKS